MEDKIYPSRIIAICLVLNLAKLGIIIEQTLGPFEMIPPIFLNTQSNMEVESL